MDDVRSGAITYTILIMTDWSGFKMFFFRHGGANGADGHPCFRTASNLDESRVAGW